MCTTCAAHHLVEPVRSWEDLVDRIGDWREARGLAYSTVDALAGLASGHSSFILGPSRTKGLSPMTFDLFTQILGVQFLLVEDPAAVAKIEHRWEPRTETHVRTSGRVSRKILDRARPVILKELIDAAAAARPLNQPFKQESAPCR
jgi:hypothetical protein